MSSKKKGFTIIMLSLILVAFVALPIYASPPGNNLNINLSYGADAYWGSGSTSDEQIFVSYGPVKNINTYDAIVNRIELTNISTGEETYYHAISSNVSNGPALIDTYSVSGQIPPNHIERYDEADGDDQWQIYFGNYMQKIYPWETAGADILWRYMGSDGSYFGWKNTTFTTLSPNEVQFYAGHSNEYTYGTVEFYSNDMVKLNYH